MTNSAPHPVTQTSSAPQEEIEYLRRRIAELEAQVARSTASDIEPQGWEALHRSEEVSRAITEYAPVALFVLDLEGRVTLANPAAERLLGWEEHELLGRVLHDVAHHHHADGRPFPAQECPIAKSHNAGQVLENCETVFFRQDGSRVDVVCATAPIKFSDGRIAGSVQIIHPATERALVETSRRLNAVLDNTTMAVFLMDHRQHCVYANAAAEALTGYALAEMQGRPLHDVVHHKKPDGSHYPLHECPIDRAFPERAQMQGEELFVHKDGSFYPVAFTASPVLDDHGQPVGTVIEARNIAEQKAREAALRENAERLAITFDQVQVGICETGLDGRFSRVNPTFAAIIGYREDELVGTRFADLTHPDDRGRDAGAFSQLISGERDVYRTEKRYLRRDGTTIWAALQSTMVRDDGRAPLYALSTIQDITNRKDAEGRLREESRTLETLNRTGAALAAELDLERIVQMVTDAGVELTGAGFGAFFYNVLNEAGESLLLYTLSGADRSAFETFGTPRATAVFQPTFKGEGIIRSDDILADPRYGKNAPHRGMPKGHLPVRSYLAVPVTSRSGDVIGGLFFGHPEPGRFTERHERLMVGIAGQAAIAIDNARLFQTTQRLNETLEAQVAARTAERDRLWQVSRDLFVIVGADGTYKRVNPAWTAALGYHEAELVGAGFNDFVHPDDRPAIEAEYQRMKGGVPLLEVQARMRARDGSYRHIRWLVVPAGDELYASGRDVTELHNAEEQLRQAQKMEAVGQLTGGIAHDFNNMLAVVIGSLDLLGRRLGTGDARARRYVEAATDGARRAALLTQRLLAFSRQQPLRPEPIDSNKLVAGMSDLLRHSLGADIRLETVLAGGLWRTHADPNQLENVILNLAVNARDAMPDGGRLTIETQNAHLDGRYAAAHLGVPAGQYVLIAVTDTGSGMPAEVIAKAFDPFFTTKEVGKGTGLGLSQVYGFIKQSGGHVKVYSELGQGTTVKVYLPRFVSAEGSLTEDVADAEVLLGDSQEVVLVVEDEPAVRQFSVDALNELGYRVLEADGAAAALRLLDAHPEIALLFTDVVMPDVNGRKLADEARRRRPDLRVLFTTGYTRNAVVHNGVLDPGVELIGKPFTIEELAAKVREVLDAPATVASS